MSLDSNLGLAMARARKILASMSTGVLTEADRGDITGRCRIFLTNREFRNYFHNEAPLLIWLNLDSKEEVNELYENWNRNGAHIVQPPESKPWSRLHKFVAADTDAMLFEFSITIKARLSKDRV
jgi:hypothetical protein